jgi:sensor histidine kinase regulating citrate/malate metabolism
MPAKTIQLKWKISAITILIQMLIMIAVSVIIYHYTAETIRDNMRERVGIMTDYQGETLDDIISGIRNKASLF